MSLAGENIGVLDIMIFVHSVTNQIQRIDVRVLHARVPFIFSTIVDNPIKACVRTYLCYNTGNNVHQMLQ